MAYETACKRGTKEVFNARLNLVGHCEAGKTSLPTRLMGRELENTGSTEGIKIHHITSEIDNTDSWEKSNIDPEGLIKDFSQAILAMTKNSQTSEAKYEEGEKEKIDDEQEDDKDIASVSGDENPTENWRKEKQVKPGGGEEDRIEPTGATDNKESLLMSDNIKEEIFQHSRTQSEDAKPLSITLWDLGGQNEFMATHHMFLNVETTSLIVMDITKKLEDYIGMGPKSGHPNTAIEILRYWLNAFTVEAMEKKMQPNIALVLTHIDEKEDTEEMQKKYIQVYKENILEAVKDYPELITRENIYTVDNKMGSKSEFTRLRSQILQHLTKQETWGMKMPLPWLKLKADIINRASDMEKKYLYLQEVLDLAKQYGMRNIDVQSFLQKQDILGNFIHYTDPELRNIVIIDPQWLIDKCSALITTHEFLDERKHLKTNTPKNVKSGYATEDGLYDL